MEWYSLIAPAALTYRGTRWLRQKFKARKEKRLEYNRQRERFERDREQERQRLAAIPKTAEALTQMRLAFKYLEQMDKSTKPSIRKATAFTSTT